MSLSEPTNDDRADLAEETLRYFTKEAPGHTHYNMTDIIDESDIADLLTNLQHLCKREKLDWSYAVRIGQDNFRYETGGVQ